MLKTALMSTVLSLTVLLISHQAYAAPDCDRLQTPQQIDDGLSSVDRQTRFRAQACGLSSSDRFARGLVIQKLLSGGRLDFVIGNAPGDAKSAQVVATMLPEYAENLKWSDDGKHFTGRGPYGDAISGSMIGDTINIVLPSIRTSVQNQMSSCQARLTLNETHDAVAGPLVCAQIPGKFTLQIDL